MKRLIVAASLLAAGCVSAPKKMASDPAAAPPEAFTASSESGPAVSGEWWKDFLQPGLEETVAAALERNYDLRAAAARVGQAAARARIAVADLKPSVGASFGGARRRQNFVGLPIPGNEGGVLTSTSTTYGVSLDVSWEIDLWGRLSARARAAVADLQVSAADYSGARLSVAGQTIKTWFAIAESAEQVQLSEDTVAAFEGTAARARRRFESGVGPSVDLRLALANLAAANALLQQNRQRLDAATRQLEILVGRYPGATIERPDTLPSLPESVPGGLPAELLARRPDLVSAERRLAAADSRWYAARRDLYPRISLTVSGGRTSAALGDLTSGNFNVWSLVGNLVQPIFQGGRLRAAVDFEQAGMDERAAAFAAAALRAYSEVESALIAERLLRQQESFLNEAATQSLAAQQLSEDRYRLGVASFLEVLEAQRRALQSRSALLSTRRQALDNRVDLYLALGGGFEESEVDLEAAIAITEGES